MRYHEYVGNPHVHTSYSDGNLLHAEVATAAEAAGLNFVITTDHNVWVDGCEGYYGKVLLLVGEEVHDVRRRPQANHLLAYDAQSELAPLAPKPQGLINGVKDAGGFCFLAHPFEYGSPLSHDLPAIPWVEWEANGYAGIELWNYMSEFKALLNNRLSALIYAHRPKWGITGPFRATLRRWDELLSQGMRVGVIGGADAHGGTYRLGPLSRVVFPYEYLFRCVNTHVLTPRPLTGVVDYDKRLIYEALRGGHTWVGYDLSVPTAGFRFTARSGANQATIGDELVRTGAITFEVQAPHSGDIRLLCHGRTIARANGRSLKYTTADPGVYRVEVYRRYQASRRGWIYSSPIYIA